MARYKLGIFNRKQEGKIIDLDSIIKLEKLENLDEFTSAFDDEGQLKIYLFNQELISNEELNKNINVVYRYNGKVKKIPVIYQEMKKYLDIEYLRHELKGLSGNVYFLEKLANFYSNGSTKFNKQGLNVSDIRLYLSDVRNNGGKPFYSKMLEIAIDDLFKKAIIKEENFQTGEVKEDYRGLRDLALFIYKFNKSQEKVEQKQDKEEKQIEGVWEQSSLFDNDYVKTIAVKKAETSDDKWTLSSEGEPDFPFNSEEEINYQRYEEELETPISYDIEERTSYRR